MSEYSVKIVTEETPACMKAASFADSMSMEHLELLVRHLDPSALIAACCQLEHPFSSILDPLPNREATGDSE